ncbi:hypothetical protein BLA29_014230 [Euroglyphus maynei]|uniref:Uncharacterized protein n=1 Tax=Euroglyphus maynei TaxID=6958 RepID=A0A1Y3BGF5_EURMA|nr:hypothetical protein BLA29_014230 [Euroglyphus maynei]
MPNKKSKLSVVLVF